MDEKNWNNTTRLLVTYLLILALFALTINAILCQHVIDSVTSVSANSTKFVIYLDTNKPDEVEKVQEIVEVVEEIEEVKEEKKTTALATGVLTKSGGTNTFEGHKETYYNLPMKKVVSNAQKKGIEGDYWERDDGCKMLGDYIMVAADQKIHPYGSIVATSLGDGIVVDTGTFIQTNPQQIDIAVNW